jgi:hypothetical protein
MNEKQNQTLENISPRGFHINTGEPCECGENADYSTYSERKYSDSIVYYHNCQDCGNSFSTWIEG